MITRIWHGAVPAARADEYHAYLFETGVPDYQKTPGNLSVRLLRRSEGALVHFLMVTEWESMDAVRAFAGDEPERARYYPRDREFLVELEPHVAHYETHVARRAP